MKKIKNLSLDGGVTFAFSGITPLENTKFFIPLKPNAFTPARTLATIQFLVSNSRNDLTKAMVQQIDKSKYNEGKRCIHQLLASTDYQKGAVQVWW